MIKMNPKADKGQPVDLTTLLLREAYRVKCLLVCHDSQFESLSLDEIVQLLHVRRQPARTQQLLQMYRDYLNTRTLPVYDVVVNAEQNMDCSKEDKTRKR